MSYSLQRVKEVMNTIVKVSKINNKLLFYGAKNPLIPKKVIVTQNVKSINVFHFPITPDMAEGWYVTEFNYQNDTKVDRLEWTYAALHKNWEKETVELINKTIELA